MKSRLILYFIFLPFFIFTQVVNIENRRLGDGSYGFSGALDLSFSAQKQKDVLMSLNFKPMIQYKFNWREKKNSSETSNSKDSLQKDASQVKNEKEYKHLLLLINDLTYTAAKGVKYSDFGMSHLRYSYRIAHSVWEWESYSQIQYNKLLLQKVRYILGTGLRVGIFDIKPKEGQYINRQIRMFAGSSVFYEYEEINYSDRPMGFENAFRWSSYISTYLNFKQFELTSTTYFQPNLMRFKDVRYSGEYSVLFRVSNPFSIRFSYSHFFDSMPPETVTRDTWSVRVGFVYKLDNFKIDEERYKEMIRKLQEEEKIHEQQKADEFEIIRE
ncbi:MAG: DUF481 domain-containing protein [Brumimicrobium sp.]|nr:DUF481 domain-containing protein [Brumimicrobium sp.]